MYHAVDHKELDLGIPNPKSKFTQKEPETNWAFYFILFRVLVTTVRNLAITLEKIEFKNKFEIMM